MSASATSPGWTASLARQGRLVRKELLEILRDRRTILTLVLMPILIYPVLGVGFMQLFQAVAPSKEPRFVVGSADDRALAEFAKLEAFLAPELKKTMRDVSKLPQWDLRHVEAPQDALRDGAVDVALSLTVEGTVDKDAPGERPKGLPRLFAFEVTYLRKSPTAPTAALWIERLVAQANAHLLDRFLSHLGPRDPGARFVLERRVLASEEADGLVSLTSVIPFVLILMTITGAVYPAIDLTAGERERGTLQILMAAPVSRLRLLFAKYVTVVTLAVMTAVVNLTAMTITLWTNPLGRALLGHGGLSLGLVLALLGLLVLFASFFAAVLLTITSFARSFKEAQAYLVPVMLFALAPGAAGMVPGLVLSPGIAVIPLVNMVLLGRDLLEGTAQPAAIVLVIAATLLYAAAALVLAARVFGAEAVLYNERNSWTDLFRRPRHQTAVASVGVALWAMAVMTPIHVFAAAALPMTAAARLAGGAVLSLLIFVGVPAIFLWRGRVAWRSAFGLRRASLAAWPAAVILGLSFWGILFPFLHWLLGPVSEERRELLTSVGELPRFLPVVLVLSAIVEELFFRGFLWEALSQAVPTLANLVITSVLFCLAHVLVLSEAFGADRLFPSLILGFVLGAVRARAGSVWPGIILHVLHNATLSGLLLSGVAGRLDTLPPWVIATCGATTLVAALLLCLPSRRTAAVR